MVKQWTSRPSFTSSVLQRDADSPSTGPDLHYFGILPATVKMNAAVARVNALRALRPAASRFQPSALPQVARSFSASARRSYEYIDVSEPRPGVGQS